MGGLVNPHVSFPLTDSLWAGGATVGTLAADTSKYTLGTEIRVRAAGFITAIRFQRTAVTGTVLVGLWGPLTNSPTSRNASVVLGAGSAGTWVEVPITPFAVAAEDYVVAAIHTPVGTTGYYNTAGYFASAVRDSPGGKLQGPVSGTNPNHGGYNSNGRYDATNDDVLHYPISNFGGGSYFIDVVWQAAA